MNIFIDTAALLAVLNAADRFHPAARQAWETLLASDESVLYTSNYVLLETTALLQHRFGVDAVRLLESEILPVLEIRWIDQLLHTQALSALLAANRRNLSLVDCTSFDLMRQNGIKTVFTFDPHFREQGFNLIPEHEV